MNDVTRILSAIEAGDPHAAEQLLPLVYGELPRLAPEKMAQENPGQTLQATALLHEAYLRLVDAEQARHWNSRGHFFSAVGRTGVPGCPIFARFSSRLWASPAAGEASPFGRG